MCREMDRLEMHTVRAAVLFSVTRVGSKNISHKSTLNIQILFCCCCLFVFSENKRKRLAALSCVVNCTILKYIHTFSCRKRFGYPRRRARASSKFKRRNSLSFTPQQQQRQRHRRIVLIVDWRFY